MKKNQEGSAMIIVMCVMVVTVALSLSLLLTSSIMMNNALRTNNKEQCRISAVSVSDILTKEISSYRYTGMPEPHPEGRESDLKSKLKSVLTTEWYAYKKDASTLEQILTDGKNRFTYTLNSGQLPGTTIVELYWEEEFENALSKLDNSKPSEAAGIFQSLILYVKVTNTIGTESCSIISYFYPNVPEKTNWTDWYWEYVGHAGEGVDL